MEILDNKQLTEKLGAISEFINEKLDIDAMNSNTSTGGGLASNANIMLKDHSNDTSPRYVVAVSNKSLMPSWWIEYSDGWCEQGGSTTGTANTATTITFLKKFQNTNYNVVISSHVNISSTGGYSTGIDLKTTTSFVYRGINANNNYANTFDWLAQGYLK